MDLHTQELLDLLTIEQLDTYLFRGKSLPIFGSRIYGGQFLGQTVMAGQSFCQYPLHSMHACFIHPGDATLPVLYHLQPLQQGRSFSRCFIEAKQKEHTLFTAMLSFAAPEDGVIYQPEPPEYIFDEHLKTEQSYREDVAERLAPAIREIFKKPFHVDIRPLDFIDPTLPTPAPTQYAEFLKTYSALPENSPSTLHQAIVAYYSDYSLMNSTLRPHGLSYLTPQLQSASLNHSLYFHTAIQADEWVLYDIQATVTSQARGLNIGQMWQKGQLVCTALQKNLMRLHADAEY